ncbi:MAG: lutB [Marmoricola sp.]|nr:lutB [Marmoricola sp.]
MAEAPTTRSGSAREEILARVRTATEGALSPARPTLRPSGPVSVDLFAERVADYRAVVERCPADEVGSRVATVVAGMRVLVPEGLATHVESAIAAAVADGGELVRDTGLTPAELDAVDVVVTEARVGIAETGTIVLDHGAGQGRRALTLVPDRHVCIVRADQVVADVPDAVALLDPARPHTWISGPSATSDIELDRVEGVHGPRLLHVVVVD